jgi:3-oxoacyl-[acyl-carrier protein] reductase
LKYNDNQRLKGKSAIVTGASKGIGAAIARTFALHGANVLINYNSSGPLATELVNSLRDEPRVTGRLVTQKADVSDSTDRKELIAKAAQEFGGIDILVNNAGILLRKNFPDVSEKDYDRVMNVNLKSAFFLSQLVSPMMIQQKRGKIINISSVSALAQRSGLTYVDYVSSKAGMIGLTRSLAVNLAPSVNVNAICPGTVETDIIASMATEIKENMATESLLGRLGTPEDIAGTALFLASDDSNFITGEILTVAGGRGMR